MQLAAEAARGRTPQAKEITSEFDKLRTSGKGVSDALDGIAKNANLSDTAGIEAFSIAMRDLGVQGKASGDQIREAFAGALKGEDLAVFEVRARAALAGSRNEAELLATVLDASLREAIRRSGADFAVISGGMGEATRSAINDTELIITNLDRLKDQGVDTAAALTASIGRGIQTADSAAAIQSLRGQIEAVRKVLGDQVANTFLDQLGAKARQVTSEVGGLSAALKSLGVTSDADLRVAAKASRRLYEQVRATGGSAREQGEAFRKMAADAIASGDTSALAFARAQAAIQGFEISTDSAGRTTVRAMGEAAEATRGAGRAADGAAGSYGNMAQSAEQAAAAAKKLAEINARYASPLGADKYSAPTGGSVTGNTREERLAGQNAVDNSLIFRLRDQLAVGAERDLLHALEGFVERLAFAGDELDAGGQVVVFVGGGGHVFGQRADKAATHRGDGDVLHGAQLIGDTAQARPYRLGRTRLLHPRRLRRSAQPGVLRANLLQAGQQRLLRQAFAQVVALDHLL